MGPTNLRLRRSLDVAEALCPVPEWFEAASVRKFSGFFRVSRTNEVVHREAGFWSEKSLVQCTGAAPAGEFDDVAERILEGCAIDFVELSSCSDASGEVVESCTMEFRIHAIFHDDLARGRLNQLRTYIWPMG